MNEEQIYSDKNFQITNARVLVGGTTYALRNITSVKMTVTPAHYGCVITMIIVTIMVVFGVVVSVSEGSVGIAAAALFLVLCLIGTVKAFQDAKPDFHIELHSASGEARVYTARDKEYVEKIVDSINEAMVRCR